jgi:hypothetical protein
MTRPNWPRTRKLVHGPDKSQRHSCKDIEIDIFNRYETIHSDDTGSLSGNESSATTKVVRMMMRALKRVKERTVSMTGYLIRRVGMHLMFRYFVRTQATSSAMKLQ